MCEVTCFVKFDACDWPADADSNMQIMQDTATPFYTLRAQASLKFCSVLCVQGGRVSIVGIYAGFTNHFNIGALMEKNLGMRGGQCPVQKYWHYLLERIDKGELNAESVITHKLPLSQATHGYKIFDQKTDDCVKVVLLPQE